MKRTIATVIIVTVFLFACNETATKEKGVDSVKLASNDTTQMKMIDSATAMKAWMDYGTPGTMHKLLADASGQWKGDITMWEKAGAPPQKSVATCVNTMIMGGRYQQSINKGNWMGAPYEGMSIVGYDNARKEFVSSWIDNMGTGFMQMSGSYDSANKVIHFKGTETDPVSGKLCNVREEFKFNADGSQLMEMYGSLLAGTPEFKMMEIKFTKSK